MASTKLIVCEDVVLLMENCPYSYLPKGKMTLQIAEKIHSSHLKLLWDPANSYRAYRENVPAEYLSDTLEEELDAILPCIGHVHIKDYKYTEGLKKPFVHVPLGKGDIPYARLLAGLGKRYAGALSLEAETDQAGTIASMRTLQHMLEKI